MRNVNQQAATAAVASMAVAQAGGEIVARFPTPRLIFLSGVYGIAAFWLAVAPPYFAVGLAPLLRWALLLLALVLLLALWSVFAAFLLANDKGRDSGARITALLIVVLATYLTPLPWLRAVGGSGGQMVASYFAVWMLLSWSISGLAKMGQNQSPWPLTAMTLMYALFLLALPGAYLAVGTVTMVRTCAASSIGETMIRNRLSRAEVVCGDGERSMHDYSWLLKTSTPDALEGVHRFAENLGCRVNAVFAFDRGGLFRCTTQ